MYSAQFSGVSVSVAQDFFEVTAPATAVVVIHEIHVTQDDSETSQQLPAAIKRIPATVTSGSGGSSPTPRKLGGVLDAAASATIEVNNTTRASSSGTIEIIRRISENILNGWHWVFTPETRIYIPPSGVVIVGLETAPSAALTMSGEIIFEEIG